MRVILRRGFEAGYRRSEHHRVQVRVGQRAGPVGVAEREQVGHRVVGGLHLVQMIAEPGERLDEQPSQDAGLTAEQGVYRAGRGACFGGQPA